jgi:hypothetical protein
VFIFLREKSEVDPKVIKNLKEIVSKVFSSLPNSQIFKEFFSFFREIFYYNKDMDLVDYNLACDNLEILNDLLKDGSTSNMQKS